MVTTFKFLIAAFFNYDIGEVRHPNLGANILSWFSSGENNQKTEWHRICCFKPALRDLVYQYVKKGQRVYVSGRLTYGEITDAEGVQRATTAIIAEDVIFMSSGKTASS
jgi:single-strand DNA-binding protein